MSRFKEIQTLIEESEKNGLLVDENKILTGYSGKKLVGLLQRLSNKLVDENHIYLEVGVFQGLTLLSVGSVINNGKAYGIDNFAFFDKKGENLNIVNERKKAMNLSNVDVINLDYEDALLNLNKYIGNKKISVYFIDGPHDYRSQLVCLLLAKPYLSDDAVIIIDDCNYRHVRQANNDFLISHPEFKLMYQNYTKAHPLNLTGEDFTECKNGWWNGVNVIVKDKNNDLNPYFPETYRERTLYENEHGIHASKNPDVFVKLLPIFNFISSVFKFFFPKKSKMKGKFKSMNTYSENLNKHQFNPSISQND